MRDDSDRPNQNVSLISIHTLSDRFEADLLVSALEREGIQPLIRSFVETPYDGLFVPQRGWGLILVKEDIAPQAKKIIEPLIQDLRHNRIYVDPADIDPKLWEDLHQANPELISLNAQVVYDSAKGAYIVPYLNESFLCYPDRELIEAVLPNTIHAVNFEMYLTMLHYLLEAQNLALAGKWIGGNDIPGGQFFFRGPHKFPTDSLLKIFGPSRAIFQETSETLGGSRVNMGDIAYRFWVFSRVPILFVFWEGDEEFEPDLHIRFDETINLHIKNLDTIWAMINVVCRSLRDAALSILSTDKA